MFREGWRIFPLLLALNYFCFRTEAIGEENERFHPTAGKSLPGHSWTLPTLNWETFDKDNAPKAIRIEPWLRLQFIDFIAEPARCLTPVLCPHQPVRDKSPPSC